MRARVHLSTPWVRVHTREPNPSPHPHTPPHTHNDSLGSLLKCLHCLDLISNVVLPVQPRNTGGSDTAGDGGQASPRGRCPQLRGGHRWHVPNSAGLSKAGDWAGLSNLQGGPEAFVSDGGTPCRAWGGSPCPALPSSLISMTDFTIASAPRTLHSPCLSTSRSGHLLTLSVSFTSRNSSETGAGGETPGKSPWG